MDMIPVIQRVIAILWPSFIMAGIATVLLTTAFDPTQLFFDYEISRLAGYSICFFLFWFFGAVTAAATCYFLKPCQSIKKARDEQLAALKSSNDN